MPSGLYKIDTGKVLFDGVNINQIDKKILSQNLGVVPQDSFLLNRSILDNITLKHYNKVYTKSGLYSNNYSS
ncbi:hypothetical protein [Streptococcus pneumoniae]|uniref:hypothetical protein n=1 Tax=Streptococcus pneumoniae TaxID=1313 RepID=UPI002AB12A65|nr:hypothetical protein [Streptococcus pneumoniae]